MADKEETKVEVVEKEKRKPVKPKMMEAEIDSRFQEFKKRGRR